MNLAARVAALDWAPVDAALDERGYASLGSLLTPAECAALVAGYDAADAFRSRIVMAPRGYGRGEYKYFAYPLPDLVATLRTTLYPGLARVANRWAAALGRPADYPLDHPAYLARCHAAGQLRPTPLLLKYGPDDYNCLHQDLYGEQCFPLQAVFLLNAPGADFAGGELVLAEQRPSKWCRSPTARASSSPSTTAPCAAHAASTASPCATASAACTPASASPSASSSTTPSSAPGWPPGARLPILGPPTALAPTERAPSAGASGARAASWELESWLCRTYSALRLPLVD
jgi:uncharacterized protein